MKTKPILIGEDKRIVFEPDLHYPKYLYQKKVKGFWRSKWVTSDYMYTGIVPSFKLLVEYFERNESKKGPYENFLIK